MLSIALFILLLIFIESESSIPENSKFLSFGEIVLLKLLKLIYFLGKIIGFFF